VATSHSYVQSEKRVDRFLLPLALLTAIAIVAFWFPLQTLWQQQSQLSTLSAQISNLHNESKVLKTRESQVTSTSAAIDNARQQYQLVEPGQSLIQVLPGAGQGQVSQSTGDPGNQPLVAPSSLSPTLAVASAPAKSQNTFLSRLVRTLEFWR
jgi:cell division protein FtsB